MSEEDKELLINFVKCNEFYKEENGNLTMTIDFELKLKLNEAIKKLIDDYVQKDTIIDEMANEIYIEHNPHFNTVEDVKKYFEMRCK